MMKNVENIDEIEMQSGSIEISEAAEIEQAVEFFESKKSFSKILPILDLSKKVLLAKNVLLAEALSRKYESQIKDFEIFPITWMKCRRTQIFLQATRFPEIDTKTAKKLCRELIVLNKAMKAQDPLYSKSIEKMVRLEIMFLELNSKV